MASPLDVIQVIADMAVIGQTVQNVWEIMTVGGGDDEEIKTDVAEWLDDLYTIVSGATANNLSYESIIFKNLSANYDMGFLDWPTLGTGGGTGDMLPTGVAALVTFPTAVLGSRGRKFLPGIEEVYNVDSLWTNAFVDTLADFGAFAIDSFIGTVSGEILIPGIRITGSSVFQPFTSALVTNIPAYQRRRKQGIGA